MTLLAKLASIGAPTAPSAHLANRVRKYNDALRIAGQDFTSCNGCFTPFKSQFRGAPEGKEDHLSLCCTKCGEECMRWAL